MTSWISHLFFAVCLCSVAGTLGLLEWRLLLPILKRHRPNSIVPLLKFTVFQYLFPLGYLLMCGTLLDSQRERVFGALFLTTCLISNTLRALAFLWLAAVLCQLPKRIKMLVRDLRMRKGDVPVELEGAEELLREVCRELGIRRVPELYANDQCYSPVRIGFVRPAILLPYHIRYEPLELRIVFLHELTHYRNHDLGTKIACFLVQLFHWFNPLARNLVELYEDWAETACDLTVCSVGKGTFTPRQYVETLLAHVEVETEKEPMHHFVSIYSTPKELERRILRMRDMKLRKPLSKVAAVLICVALVSVNTVPAYAASQVLAAGYDQVYAGTVNWSEEELAEAPVLLAVEAGMVNEAGEIEIPADQVDWESMNVMEKDLSDSLARLLKAYEWDVPANTFCRSFGFSASADQYIAISVRCDNSVYAGIVEPNGDLRAVHGSGVFTHAFTLDQSGTYRFFVRNDNTFTIYVTATVSVI